MKGHRKKCLSHFRANELADLEPCVRMDAVVANGDFIHPLNNSCLVVFTIEHFVIKMVSALFTGAYLILQLE